LPQSVKLLFMPLERESEFIAVSTPILLKIEGKAPFDVYIKRATNTFTKIFQQDGLLEKKRINDYKEREINSLFVRQDDYKKYMIYVEKIADNFLQDPNSASSAEYTNVIKELADLSMYEIYFEMNVDSVSISHATNTVKGCVDLLAKDKRSMMRLMKLVSSHQYIMNHSVSTSIFSLLLAHADQIKSQKNLVAVGLGAILHDIGMNKLTFDPEECEDLTPLEWREVKEHPQLGKKMLDSLEVVSPEVKSIVLEHHEQPNGLGYPNGLRDKEIYYLAKIVAIADTFTSLVKKRPFRPAFAPLDAIRVMLEDKGKFDIELLKKFASLFVHVK